MRVLIVVGEASGDSHAAKVARRLRERGARITAVGGEALRAAGAELVEHIESLSVLGFVEVLRSLPRFVALKRRIDAMLRDGGFDLFLPVDFPGLNLRLAASASRAGVPVLYYIGPQVWAWRAGRLQRMRERVDQVALILPFEKALYDAASVPALFVGHPLLDDPVPPVGERTVDLALFPGSRPQEVVRHLPPLLDAIERVRRKRPLRAAISVAATAPLDWMRQTLAIRGIDPEEVLHTEPAGALMRSARALLVASGTATLEAALSGSPFAVFYRTGRINYAVARRLVRVPQVALANLVAGEAIVREYIQEQLHPAALEAEIERLLTDEAERARIGRGLERVRARLGTPGASERVAALAFEVASRRVVLA
ncbi:MAG: lipid-A-disaccharide synthase [Candidatus Latescibacterota bacterium]|nr:MAG: lipid-A-disaccharide synthase [Candidatus Latescibacterota bacterium]